MNWLELASKLEQEEVPHVIVTVAEVRGHAPRGAGSKLLVTATELYGSVGGGNLEHSAVLEARQMIEAKAQSPKLMAFTLNLGEGDHGVQCCGGRVSLLLEPFVGHRPLVAVFGAGHVGWALVQVLAMLPIDITLVDSRAAQLDEARLPSPRSARVSLRQSAAPESVIRELPDGAHVVVLTHDHAEDIAVIDMALRRQGLAYIGLIGSRVKWTHFKRRLLEAGHDEDALTRVTTPIGLPQVRGKSPQAIAIATAAELLTYLELDERST